MFETLEEQPSETETSRHTANDFIWNIKKYLNTTELTREMLSELIRKQVNGITKEQAMLFYLEMWTYVHGIATMIATNFYDWDEELCSKTLTDMYLGLKQKYENK